MKTVFSSFQDAAEFSRSLATRRIWQQLKRNGKVWEVDHAEDTKPEASQEQVTQKLKEENETLRATMDQKANE